MIQHLEKYRYLYLSAALALLAGWYFSLPQKLFSTPFATVLQDADGQLLSVLIADDEQWRFPESDSVPPRFATAIRYFEDEHFYLHPGVNPFSMARAAWQNLQAGRVVSGGSTLTMQVIRLARKGRERTFLEKLLEVIMATRLEARLSKDDILRLYASHAPFGGNIVGLEAAAFRYFGRRPAELSWGEAALLAVLPNQPALIFPGKNQHLLLKKRDRLLKKLQRQGVLDSLTASLAMEEPLPDSFLPLPGEAPHLLLRMVKEGKKGQRLSTTLDYNLQTAVADVLERYQRQFQGNGVHNAAALVMETRSGRVRAYLGNTGNSRDHGSQVDVITAPRSTGSILKPFLYASMLHEGELLPDRLVPDIPTYMGGFAPENFDGTYAGAVKASKALSRSLNIPFVRMLMSYRTEKFHSRLRDFGLSTINQPPGHYGLSLILGGAEATLEDLCTAYGSMARVLLNFGEHSPHHYAATDWHPPVLLQLDDTTTAPPVTNRFGKLGAAAVWFTLQAMLEVERPAAEASWRAFENARNIAWKTGTSYGHRDAWAVGVTSQHVVAVWVGNADGEGRPGLTGFNYAAPVLFEIFGLLPPAPAWFTPPYDDFASVAVCPESGCLKGPWCPAGEVRDIPAGGIKSVVCPWHRLASLDASGQWRVHADCEQATNMQQQHFFVLPPAQEYYYKARNARYRELPPWRADCRGSQQEKLEDMQVVYPLKYTEVTLPRELDGNTGGMVVEVAHRKPGEIVYWHLNGQYLGETRSFHQMTIYPEPGNHTLTLTDASGQTLEHPFSVQVTGSKR